MAGGIEKITEKTIASAAASNAHVLLTQPEILTDGEDPVEALRRVPITALANRIAQLLSLGETYVSVAQLQEMYPSLIKDIEQVDEGIRVTFWDDTETVITVAASGGLAFDGGYVDDNGYLHLTQDGLDIDGFDPFFVGNGGGGGSSSGSRLTFSMTSDTSFSVADTSGVANLSFVFQSVDAASDVSTGNGTLKIYVGGTLKRSVTVQQGSSTINVFDYLNTGANTVKLIMTDSYGATATRTCYITREALTLSWNLEATQRNSGILTVNLTPTGTGTKSIVLKVDGVVYSTDTVTSSGRRITKSVTGLAHGGHVIEAYCSVDIDGTTLTTDTLTAAVAQVAEGNTAPVIACQFNETHATQYTTIALIHRVIDPNNNPTTVEYIVKAGQTVISSDEVRIDQSEQLWSFRPTQAGTITLEIVCGTSRWSHTVIVDALETPVEEVTENLALKFDPSAINSLNGWSYDGATISLSQNFDNINGGLKTDEEGARGLRVMKGDRATINFNAFGDDARRTGKEFKIIYKVENCSDFNATAVSCFSDGIGLKLKANNCICSSEQSTLEMQTCEGMRTELDLNVEPDSGSRIMTFWEEGSPGKGDTYADSDNFMQAHPVGITIGSDDCNVWIYLIRCYTSDLTDTELKANFVADGKDGEEITNRYNASLIYDNNGNIDPERCAEICPDAHVLTFHAPGISTSKENKVRGYLTHKFVAGGPEHTWTAEEVEDKVQGTSSAAYVLAGLNHDFKILSGFTLEDSTVIEKYAMTPNSIPVDYFNFKLNVASSENVNNIMLSEWYNRFQKYRRPARIADARVRDCIEGHMALLFYHNTGSTPVQAGATTVMPNETILYGIGNLNNSKKNLEVFAQTDEADDDQIVIEMNNNTSNQTRFKSDDLTGETWDDDGNFQFRYLSDELTQAEAIELWQEALSFVVSCDPDQATNRALTQPVTYEGETYNLDTRSYRLAKFKAEAGNYFVMDSLDYHFLFTLTLCMPDNRAKNTFWGWSKQLRKWHLVFSYDHDTGMGNDNEGGLTLRYGYLDTDAIGTKNVFNAADSVLWSLIREVFSAELRAMFIDLENDGCWNLDELAALCDAEQRKVCPALWAEDARKKYIDPLVNSGSSAYLPMLNGKKRLQRAQFLKFQKQFISSYYISGYVRANTGTIRGYTPTTWAGVQPESKMTITPYVDMFVTVKAGSITTQQRAYAGIPVELNLGVPSMNDTEIYPYNAPFIQDIGDLSCLYPGYCDLAPFTRLKRAKIGSEEEGYTNTNLTEISVTNCEALEYLNVENCPALEQALSLTNNIMLEELITRGSGVTGVTFAAGARVQTAHLNDIVSLTAKHLYYLTTLSFEDYNNLRTLVVEESPAINSLLIVQAAAGLAYVRLLEVDWSMNNSEPLLDIAELGGVDDDGYNTGAAVLTGVATVNNISETRLNELAGIFPGLTIVYDELLPEHTVTFKLDENTVWETQHVEHGGKARTPATNPPTSMTIDKVRTFVGWSGSYNNILQDTVIMAVYSETTRQYTVRFFDGINVVQTSVVDYNGSCDYTGADLERSGFLWTGWDASTKNVAADLDVHAVYESPALPQSVADMTQFDYLYSDNPNDTSAYTIGELYAICAAGLASTYMSVGDKIKITLIEGKTVNDEYIIFQCYGFNHFKLEDGTAFANAVFGMKGVLVGMRRMNQTNTNVGGWRDSEMRGWLNNTMLYNLPTIWRNVIKSVQVLSSAGNQSANILTSIDKLFLFSWAEVGFDTNAVPYKNEIDEGAERRTFAIFTDSNSRIKKTFNGEGSASGWWLRSPYATGSTYFGYVSGNGDSTSYNAAYSNGVAFGFCI